MLKFFVSLTLFHQLTVFKYLTFHCYIAFLTVIYRYFHDYCSELANCMPVLLPTHLLLTTAILSTLVMREFTSMFTLFTACTGKLWNALPVSVFSTFMWPDLFDLQLIHFGFQFSNFSIINYLRNGDKAGFFFFLFNSLFLYIFFPEIPWPAFRLICVKKKNIWFCLTFHVAIRWLFFNHIYVTYVFLINVFE